MIFTVEDRNLANREVSPIVQHHNLSKAQSWDLNPDLSSATRGSWLYHNPPICHYPMVDFSHMRAVFILHTASASPGIARAVFQAKFNSYFSSLRAILGKPNTLTPPAGPRLGRHSVFRRYFWSQFSYTVRMGAMIRHNGSLRLLLAFLKYPSRTMLAPLPWMEPRRKFLWNTSLKRLTI